LLRGADALPPTANAGGLPRCYRCEYYETPPKEWSEGLVGFKPAPVFDISQTEGEPLPDLDTEATGDAGDLVEQLTAAADDLGVTVRIVPVTEWTHGEAKGICEQLSLVDVQPLVEVRDRANKADLARTLIHEYAHALLHFDVDDEPERAKREVEAEAVAYIVGRYFGLDTSGSAFYLAAWQNGDAESIQKRLGRISLTAQEIIGTIAEDWTRLPRLLTNALGSYPTLLVNSFGVRPACFDRSPDIPPDSRCYRSESIRRCWSRRNSTTASIF
jgi:hypothetical protein